MSAGASYIRAGWLLDGSGGPPLRDALLTIAGGRFAGVQKYAHATPPPADRLTDLSPCTVVPPFVDSHVHLSFSGTADRQARQWQRSADYRRIRPLIARHLRAAFAHGVLALRDGGDAHGHVLRYLQEDKVREASPLMVVTTGRAWHRAGRYGGFLGRHPAAGESLARACELDQDAADQVKVINSGVNSLQNFALQTLPQFTGDELREVVRLAAAKGRRVMVHANGELPVRLAVEAGCHSIEHGYFMGRNNLELMAAKGVAWVPTLVPLETFATQLAQENRRSELSVARRTLQHQLEQVALANEMGVTIALGTDAGSIGVHHGQAVAAELRLLGKAGLTLGEAIRCAAWNGSQLLGLADRLGCIAEGRPAHFLVLRGRPDHFPDNVPPLEEIYLLGHPCLGERPHPD